MNTKALFPADAKRTFMAITGRRYNAMRDRLAKKGMLVPFTMSQLRLHLLDGYMGEEYDGAVSCKYCFKVCTLEDTALDHAIPLGRGGSPELSNIELPCAPCNDRKGEMLPDEFHALLAFLFRELPHARIGILKRLQEHSKLLANHRRAQMALHPKAPKQLSSGSTQLVIVEPF